MDSTSLETPYSSVSLPRTQHFQHLTAAQDLGEEPVFHQAQDEFDEAMLNRAIEISQSEQVAKFYSKTNELKLKYRKMIPNMKLKSTSQKCTICLDDFVPGEVIKKLPCKHIMHRECAKKWLKVNKNCPVCRLDLEKYYSQRPQPAQLANACEH